MLYVILADEPEGTSTLEHTTSLTHQILQKVSEKGIDIFDSLLEDLAKVGLGKIEKNESHVIVADVDSLFDS
jgi:hypothetical protein